MASKKTTPDPEEEAVAVAEQTQATDEEQPSDQRPAQPPSSAKKSKRSTQKSSTGGDPETAEETSEATEADSEEATEDPVPDSEETAPEGETPDVDGGADAPKGDGYASYETGQLSDLDEQAEAEAEAVPDDVAAEPPAATTPRRKGRAKKAPKPSVEEELTSGGEEPAKLTPRQERAQAMAERARRSEDRAERLEKNQAFYAGISSLQAAKNTKAILSGYIVAVEPMPTGRSAPDGQQNLVMVSVMVDNRYKVMIPFEELYRDDPLASDSVDRHSREGWADIERRQRQLAEKLYGNNITFCVTNVLVKSPDDYAISGSRKMALEIQERRNFDEKAPRIKEGGVYTAQILSVGNYALFVSLGGVDATIPLRDATFAYCRTLHDKFSACDTINVEVQEVKRRADGRVALTLSGLSPELADARERQKSGIVSPKMRTLGQIVSIKNSSKHPGKIVIRAYLQHFGMPAVVRAMSPSDLGVAPKAGDWLRLEVNTITDSGFVVCTCRGYQDAPKIIMGGRA